MEGSSDDRGERWRAMQVGGMLEWAGLPTPYITGVFYLRAQSRRLPTQQFPLLFRRQDAV